MNITAQHDDHSGRLFLHVDNLGMSQPPSKSYFGETNISDFDVNCSARVLYNMIHLKEIAASYDTYDLKTFKD